MSNTRDHWQNTWAKNPAGKSWIQNRPDVSLAFIEACGLPCDAAVLDMGGGASTLVDYLLAAGYTNITVADLSKHALQLAKLRLQEKADPVRWLEADARIWKPPGAFDVWHDRAVFHFLTEQTDRTQYKIRLYDAVPIGGFLVMATFAPGGPKTCSGLCVQRYDAQAMADEIGAGFVLLDAQKDIHHTPSSTAQEFQYCRFKRV